METVECRDPQQWNASLSAIPGAHVLQSWEWGELKRKFCWDPVRLLFVENGAVRAAAQVLRRPIPRTPFGVMYVPKGPALDYANTPLLRAVLAALEDHGRKQRAVFVKADPDIEVGSPAAQVMPDRGWQISAEQIQFRNTVTLDLTPAEDEILGGMKPKWRYNIRLAEKKGVRVESATEQDLPLFYELYRETSSRDDFLIRPFAYYQQVWTTMMRGGLAHLFIARVGDEAIAALILFLMGSRAWYFYGASRDTRRELMPNHLLQWEAMRWAKEHGVAEYDFWGAPDRLEESQPMYGVYRFKMGFGARFTERIGAYDYVFNPALYYLYAVVRPRYLGRLRRKQQTLPSE
jgi:lipid II:glycine glycyltransferase (peptidoglycan interpeptide bridge formation enzyme)